MHDQSGIGFRRLRLTDLPLMHRWLNTEHVLQWYGVGAEKGPSSLETVTAHYSASILGQEPTEPYAILYDATPIGYIQSYAVRDHPEYAAAVQVEEHAMGVDLFIGEPAFVHRALGAPILRRFLREVVFAHPDVTSCVIGPAVGNRAAIRAYGKAGFAPLKVVSIAGEDEPEYLMRISREDMFAEHT